MDLIFLISMLPVSLLQSYVIISVENKRSYLLHDYYMASSFGPWALHLTFLRYRWS